MKKRYVGLFLSMLIFTISFMNTENTHANDNSNVLGTYTTRFGVWDKPRTKNIQISAKAIDYHVIKSGETFSFNNVVGDRTIAKGYEESTVFIYDQKTKGVGGGVCQLSTTLYNTAVYANMEIVERHTHKREIYYAPNGKDATVDYPTLDFKFKNNYPYDVLIRAYTVEDRLTVEIRKI